MASFKVQAEQAVSSLQALSQALMALVQIPQMCRQQCTTVATEKNFFALAVGLQTSGYCKVQRAWSLIYFRWFSGVRHVQRRHSPNHKKYLTWAAWRKHTKTYILPVTWNMSKHFQTRQRLCCEHLSIIGHSWTFHKSWASKFLQNFHRSLSSSFCAFLCAPSDFEQLANNSLCPERSTLSPKHCAVCNHVQFNRHPLHHLNVAVQENDAANQSIHCFTHPLRILSYHFKAVRQGTERMCKANCHWRPFSKALMRALKVTSSGTSCLACRAELQLKSLRSSKIFDIDPEIIRDLWFSRTNAFCGVASAVVPSCVD